MRKKVIFLFLALALPGLVFVFLKKFGHNEFTIPKYYQSAVDSLNTLCGTRYLQPYQVPDSVLASLSWKAGHPALVVLDSAVLMNSEFRRLGETFLPADYQSMAAFGERVGEVRFRRWYSCVWFAHAPYNLVLLDAEKTIRGYYAVGTREETDRLIVELQILLKKY